MTQMIQLLMKQMKHHFKGEHDIMEKMNINGHQSQSSGLYS